MNDRELQDEKTWDFSKAERKPGIKKRTVVSVAFNREDFERVAEHAERLRMKISEYIRNAALQCAEEHPHIVTFVSGSLGAVIQVRELAPTTSRETPPELIETDVPRVASS